MQNKLIDLNNYLFEQLERLNDDSLTMEELDREIKKSKEIVKVSQTIVNNADILLKAKKYFDEAGISNEKISLLSLGEKND